MSIGENVKKRRKTLRLTQTELSEKSKVVTQALICKLEGGEDNVKIDTLRGIAKALGCSVVDLLSDEDKRRIRAKTAP